MSPDSWSSRLRDPLLGVALISGGVIWLMLPAGVAAMNDDFGYLGSVMETLRRGRPWTDDWLEPWSASLAVLSASVFGLTGSFSLATQGVQAVCAALGGAGAFVLLRARGLTPRAAWCGALIGLSGPTLVWKSTEYTGMVLYVPCLLWAVWAAGERRWFIFFVAWLIAVSTRQSAVAWLALPGWELLAGGRRSPADKSGWIRPALALGGAALALAVLSLAMNHTQAQRMITDHLWERVQYPAASRNIMLGLGIWAVYSGLGALLLGASDSGFEHPRHYARRILGLLILGIGAFTCLDRFPVLFYEHGSYEAWSGHLYANLLIGGGIMGWMLVRFSVRGDLLLAALAGLGVVVLRSDVWDYYFADIALFAFLGVAPSRTRMAPETRAHWPVAAVAAAAVVLASFHLWFACQLKCRVDRDWAVCVISEKGLRAGTLDPLELAHAPYGFIGWHLHRHFVRHAGAQDADIGGFMRYLRPGATELRYSPLRFWSDSRSLQPLPSPDDTRVIASEVFRVGWLWHQRVTLLHSAAPPAAPARLGFERSDYQPRRFPLNAEEWAADLAGP